MLCYECLIVGDRANVQGGEGEARHLLLFFLSDQELIRGIVDKLTHNI